MKDGARSVGASISGPWGPMHWTEGRSDHWGLGQQRFCKSAGRHTLCASAFSAAATLMRLAALISFMASLTLWAGSMSVTSACRIRKP